MARTSFTIPDVFRSPNLVERFLERIAEIPSGLPATLHLGAVMWVCPYGAVVLLGACRYLAELTNQTIQLEGLTPGVHAYLRRIDFFEQASGAASTDVRLDPADELGRNPQSSNVLELVRVAGGRDVYAVSERARRILIYWLQNASHDIDRIISLLAEACGNVADHSGDVGVVSVQKYERSGSVDVDLAISDLGLGIHRSLEVAHGRVADSPAGYIEQALGGLSSRPRGRGGHGLGAIQRIATASGGHLHIRSGTGRVGAYPRGTVSTDGLPFFPGTQVAITFRSPR